MYSTWEFLKRHRTKIIAGTTIAGVLYSTKRVVESELVAEYTEEVRKRIWGPGETATTAAERECVEEARWQFVFEMQQQSCDKFLRKKVPELRRKIQLELDTEALLEELKSSTKLTPLEKIDIWNKLKINSLSKIVAIITVFPLVIIISKAQKSILCQQLLPGRKQSNGSFINNGWHLVKSMLNYSDVDDSSQAITNSGNYAKELFGHTLNYFCSEGIELLLGLIEQVTLEVADVELSQPFNTNDLLFLFERIRTRMKAICEGNNYADFVIPKAEVNLSNIQKSDRERFHILLQHFGNLLELEKTRELRELFSNWYLDNVMQVLDSSLPHGTSLPFAKIIPIIYDAFCQIALDSHGSTFHTIISSTELHQFTLFVSACSKPAHLFS